MKIAIEELAGCSGCTIAVLDLHEAILDLVEEADIVYSPVIMDVKEPPEDIDIAFVTGAVRNEENQERLKKIRKNSRVLVALGTCACYGGISGLSMMSSREELFNKVYRDVDSAKENGIIPHDVPEFLYRVFAVGDMVKIDYYIPGCPPKEARLKEIILPLVKGDTISLSRKSVCSECDRKMGEVTDWSLKRRHEGIPDRETCLLGQGYLCLGAGDILRLQCSMSKEQCPLSWMQRTVS